MLDSHGWADIGQLLALAAQHGRRLSREQLNDVVARDSKPRYAISDDSIRIRANQGHSLAAVDIALPPATPSAVLYHGTASRSLRQFAPPACSLVRATTCTCPATVKRPWLSARAMDSLSR